MMIDSGTVALLVPEIILVVTASVIFLGGTFVRSRRTCVVLATLAIVAAAAALYRQYDQLSLAGKFAAGVASQMDGPLAVDYFGHALRWLALLVGLLLVLTASRAGSRELAGEYLGSLLLVIAGLMLVAAAGELVLMFLGLELISIPTYVLLFLGRRDQASAEATAKYFFLGLLSSALLLYGFSFLYGMAGTTSLAGIHDALLSAHAENGDAGLLSLAPVALVLIFAGFGFKLAAVPFHFYAPDVYQGTTNANAALLAVVPKIAGIVGLVRLVVVAMPGLEPFAWRIALALALLTMTLGNVAALWQGNLRRLLAYSSIAHSGYMLIGLAVGLAAATAGGSGQMPYDGIAAMLFYLLVYVLASLGMLAALACLGSRDRELSEVEELAGLAQTHPTTAAAIAIFMFSLTGIPPLAGFWGKLTLFTSALGLAGSAWNAENFPLSVEFVVLAVAGALNAAIAAAYYLRVVAVMYFRDSRQAPKVEGGRGAWTAMMACAVLVVAAGLVFPGTLSEAARHAASSTSLRVPADLRTSRMKHLEGRVPEATHLSDRDGGN